MRVDDGGGEQGCGAGARADHAGRRGPLLRGCDRPRRVLVVAAVLAVLAAVRGRAQDPATPFEPRPDAAETVFVSGVPDTFDDVRTTIANVKRDSGRDYRVIVVGKGPDGEDGVRDALDRVLERWSREVPPGSSKTAFDPSQDSLIYVDVSGRRVAMRAAWSLETVHGLDQDTVQRELIEKVFLPRARGGRLDEAVVDLVEGTERFVKERTAREVARRDAEHRFRTRTLPAGVALVAGLAGLGFVLSRWSLHGKRLREARGKLAAFKREVVALSDLLDAQQERHRMLPHSDPDFLTPMEGRTRAAYDGVQEAIHRYRERWLGLMDVWERADAAIQSEQGLGTARAEEAIRLLDSAESRPPLEEVARECTAPLDDLEQAHEKARALSADLGERLAAVKQRTEGLAGRGRSGASFQAPLVEVDRGLSVARSEVEPDPVAARARLEQAVSSLETTVARLDAFEALDDRRRRAVGQTDALDAAIRARRAEGWLLREPGADPAAHVAEARRRLGLAEQVLDAGEIEAAQKHLEETERVAGEGAALLENVVAAKARVEELLPGCIARLDALAGRRGATEDALRHLDASYAPASWSDVADNAAKADEGLSRARAMIAEGQAAARPDRQEFFRAVALVEEAARQLEWVDRCHASVADRRADLDGLRTSLPEKASRVGERVGALGRRLQAQATDRVRANEQWREADRLVRVAGQSLSIERPDLPRSAQVIDAADAAAAGAERLADDDERLARQAFGGIEAADHDLRRAAGWYAEGVKPDVRAAGAAIEDAKALLSRQRYEEAIRVAADAQRLAHAALAEAQEEATRRRMARELEAQRRQMEDSFVRMSRGAGPWVIKLPGGTFSGPDPWRTLSGGGPDGPSGAGSRTASGGWGSRTAEGSW